MNMQNKKILGIITARGGSKRVPEKNIREFLGKPLLAWSIEVGEESGVFDRFILTTDREEIAKVGKEHDIEIPFIRPAELASDTSSSYYAIKHAVEWLKENENYEADWIILLEPSAPGRQPFHIKEVAELIQKENNNFDSIFSISKTPAHFSYLKELQKNKNNIITRVNDNEILRNLTHRNQDILESYYINSAIYAFKVSNLFDGNNSLCGNSTFGYEMEEKYAIDIDTPEDWIIAKAKMKQLIKK